MPTHNPAPMIIEPGPVFNAKSLRQSANAIIDKFNAAKNPVLMFGARALAWARQVDGINDRQLLLQQLAKTAGCGFVVQPGGKGLLNEQAEGYMGVYWGHVSLKGCQQAVEQADLVVAVGTHWVSVGKDSDVKVASGLMGNYPFSFCLDRRTTSQPAVSVLNFAPTSSSVSMRRVVLDYQMVKSCHATTSPPFSPSSFKDSRQSHDPTPLVLKSTR